MREPPTARAGRMRQHRCRQRVRRPRRCTQRESSLKGPGRGPRAAATIAQRVPWSRVWPGRVSDGLAAGGSTLPSRDSARTAEIPLPAAPVPNAGPDGRARDGRADERAEGEPAMEADRVEELTNALHHCDGPGSGSGPAGAAGPDGAAVNALASDGARRRTVDT